MPKKKIIIKKRLGAPKPQSIISHPGLEKKTPPACQPLLDDTLKPPEKSSSSLQHINTQDSLWNDFQDLMNETLPKKETKPKPSSETSTDLTQICPECHSDTLIEGASGQYECTSCGVLSGQVIDSGAEWRFYGSEDSKFSDPTRCGMPTNELLPQSSLGSTISFKRKESYQMRRIRTNHQYNAMTYNENNLYNVF